VADLPHIAPALLWRLVRLNMGRAPIEKMKLCLYGRTPNNITHKHDQATAMAKLPFIVSSIEQGI
jgi:hypothetical protein